MVHHIIQFVVFALAVLVTAKVVPGIRVKSFGGALWFAIVLAILNKLCLGALIFFSLPLVLVTFGLFILVLNGLLYWAADKIVGGGAVSTFGTAMLGSLGTWLIH